MSEWSPAETAATHQNPMHKKTKAQREEIARKAHETRRKNKEQLILDAEIKRAKFDKISQEIIELEARLDALKAEEKLQAAAMSISGKYLLSREEIAAASAPWQNSAGVYFLLKENNIVYVGQSVNVFARISQHTNKDFDSFAFILCGQDALDKVESLYIHILKPRLNGNNNENEKRAPIGLADLLGIANTTLPKNLYSYTKKGKTYYRYRHPETGKLHHMGNHKESAISDAISINKMLKI